MFAIIIGALLPVVVTLGLGMLAGRHGDQDSNAARSLNRMVLRYALPLTLFAGTVTIPRKELLSDWRLFSILSAGTLLAFVAAWLTARYGFHRDLSAATLQALVFGFPAIPFTGIPILTPLIKGKATEVVDFAGLAENVFILPLAFVLLAFAQGSVDGGNGKSKSFFQPSPARFAKPCCSRS